MPLKFKRTCHECGETFTTTHPRKDFCTPAHSKAFNNRQLGRGQRMVSLAMAWRAGRSTKDPTLRAAAKDAFSTLCRELDVLITEDREAGRIHPTKLHRRRKASGLLDYQGPLTH